MLDYISAIFSRYCSALIQFLIIILVTRYFSAHDAGIYLQLLGVVSATYFLAGLGIPDGLVKSISSARANGDYESVRPLIRKSFILTTQFSLIILSAGLFAGWVIGVNAYYLTFISIWWLCLGLIFYCAQALLALGSKSLGSFYFYPAANIFQLVFLGPYLLASPQSDLYVSITLTVVAVALCAIMALLHLRREVENFSGIAAVVEWKPMLRLGFVICLSRTFQSCIFWLPVWMVGVFLGASEAGILAVASRLAVVVASAMAAVRFVVRPAIVAAEARGDWAEIERTGRLIATAATIGSIVALVISLVAGEYLIAWIFGESYRAAALLFSILLIGAIGESFGGPVDEILRMTGRSVLVLKVLIGSAVAELVLILFFHSSGLAVSIAQSLSIVGMYGIMILYLKKSSGVLIVPYVTLGQLKKGS